MPSITKSLAISLATFTFKSSALPTAETTLIARQDPTQCTPPLVFYSCANGARGCFDHDPCSAPQHGQHPPQHPTQPEQQQQLPAQATAQCPPGNEKARVWLPSTYNFYPGHDSIFPAPHNSSQFLRKDIGDPNELQQVIAFRGASALPKGVTSCKLGVDFQAAPDRVWVCQGTTCYLSVQQIEGIAPEPKKAGDVGKEVGAVVDSVEMTGWAELPAAKDFNALTSPTCAEEMFFKVRMSDVGGVGGEKPQRDGHVYFENTDVNGWYVEYSCGQAA